MTCDLEKLKLVDHNCLDRDFSAFLRTMLGAGRRHQSESIMIALVMEFGGFDEPFRYY